VAGSAASAPTGLHWVRVLVLPTSITPTVVGIPLVSCIFG
jgi:hypothetical protein